MGGAKFSDCSYGGSSNKGASTCKGISWFLKGFSWLHITVGVSEAGWDGVGARTIRTVRIQILMEIEGCKLSCLVCKEESALQTKQDEKWIHSR